MFAPLFKFGAFGEELGFILAFLIGISFGFFLERAGFGSSRKISAEFYGRDFAVLRVMFTAIVVAMLLTQLCVAIGILDYRRIYLVPTILWAQILGGLLFGIGLVIAGYCPGTSVVASITGKIDAVVAMGGILFGVFVFGVFRPFLGGLTGAGAMGRRTLSDWLHLRPGVVSLLVVFMALGAFWFVGWLEPRLNRSQEVIES